MSELKTVIVFCPSVCQFKFQAFEMIGKNVIGSKFIANGKEYNHAFDMNSMRGLQNAEIQFWGAWDDDAYKILDIFMLANACCHTVAKPDYKKDNSDKLKRGGRG